MEKERRVKALTVVSLIIAIVFLSVAFAAMSTTLNIKGKTAIEAAIWDIHFDNLSSETKGEGKVIKMPEMSEDGKTLTNFQASLKKPGDSVDFKYYIVNDGDFDAEISDICINDYCLSNASDTDKIYFFEEADLDGDGITTEEELKEASKMIEVTVATGTIGDTFGGDIWNINKGQTVRNAHLEISFKQADRLPIGNLILNLDLKYIYTQK